VDSKAKGFDPMGKFNDPDQGGSGGEDRQSMAAYHGRGILPSFPVDDR
jgi:hypothetical protein